MPGWVPASASAPYYLRVTTSVNDHLRNRTRSLVKYVFPSNTNTNANANANAGGAGAFATPAQDMGDAVASFVSPSGTHLVVLRESTTNDIDARFVEVWQGDLLMWSKDVTGEHGSFYTDGMSPPSLCPLSFVLFFFSL